MTGVATLTMIRFILIVFSVFLAVLSSVAGCGQINIYEPTMCILSSNLYGGGDYGNAFDTMCSNKDHVENCLQSFRNTMEKCYSNMIDFQKIISAHDLTNILCSKEGKAVITLFSSMQKDDKQCLYMKTGNVMSKCSSTADPITKFTFNKKQCDQMSEMLDCTSQKYQGCGSEADEFVEATYKLIRKAWPCGSGNGVSGVFVTSGTLLVAVVTASSLVITL